MSLPIAERFFAPQGEGLFTGTPMAFLRFVGCSVGKKICLNCDTAFERMDSEKGGGLFEIQEIIDWVGKYEHVCITGGEPCDRNLEPLIEALADKGVMCHIETSGTKHPAWLNSVRVNFGDAVWLCVSPKPGYLNSMIQAADEIKVILQGLGDGVGWPTRQYAIDWAQHSLVYIQPANYEHSINEENLQEAIDVVLRNPQLRLSIQAHKFLRTR